jgi:hypothetical protein
MHQCIVEADGEIGPGPQLVEVHLNHGRGLAQRRRDLPDHAGLSVATGPDQHRRPVIGQAAEQVIEESVSSGYLMRGQGTVMRKRRSVHESILQFM